jgi:hypothetical protein
MGACMTRGRLPTAYALALSAIGCGGLKDGSELSPGDASLPVDAANDTGASDASSDTSATGDGGADADAGTDAPPGPVPIAVAPSNLRLWLTADKAMPCDHGRVTIWHDQSGRGDDAVLQHAQLGPQCLGPTSAHAANGVALPYFSRPMSATTPNVVDETLDVDLQFLASSSYTIFAIERRWADQGGTLVGTTLPIPDQHPFTCNNLQGVLPNSLVSFGYTFYGSNAAPQITLDQVCNVLIAPATSFVPNPPPAPLTEDMARFDTQSGHELWVNGVRVDFNADTSPATIALSGAVGRGYADSSWGYDARFDGDIAEILVYDTALDDASRLRVENYLRAHWSLSF